MEFQYAHILWMHIHVILIGPWTCQESLMGNIHIFKHLEIQWILGNRIPECELEGWANAH